VTVGINKAHRRIVADAFRSGGQRAPRS
jgi:hypothetical protein